MKFHVEMHLVMVKIWLEPAIDRLDLDHLFDYFHIPVQKYSGLIRVMSHTLLGNYIIYNIHNMLPFQKSEVLYSKM